MFSCLTDFPYSYLLDFLAFFSLVTSMITFAVKIVWFTPHYFPYYITAYSFFPSASPEVYCCCRQEFRNITILEKIHNILKMLGMA